MIFLLGCPEISGNIFGRMVNDRSSLWHTYQDGITSQNYNLVVNKKLARIFLKLMPFMSNVYNTQEKAR